MRVVVLMPVKDDWEAAAELIRRLDKAFEAERCEIQIVLVDDGSVEPIEPRDYRPSFSRIRRVRVLRLRRNLGHQRAIAIGLVHVARELPCDAVIVMDGDGEDTPEGAVDLFRAFDGTTAIFAARSRRTESLLFRSFYLLFKMLHRVFTGLSVRVGNFSILPPRYLETLIVMSELWNHYAAAVFRSGLRFRTRPIPRGVRIVGKPTMNFVSLTAHGISAISVFGDVVGVRLLIASMAASAVVLLAILIVLSIRLFTREAIPGWASYSVGILVVILIQIITIATSFTFTILANRVNLSFVPLRDYELFVTEPRDLYLNA